MQRRVPLTVIRTRTLCLASSRSLSSQHAADRLNAPAFWTNTSVLRPCGTERRFSATSASSDHVMNVFDRNTKRKQRNRTAHLPDYSVYDYLKDEV